MILSLILGLRYSVELECFVLEEQRSVSETLIVVLHNYWQFFLKRV
jgi:hypothetical protein